MRKRELCMIVGFDTTTDAFAMEEAAKENRLEGRLIPVPLQITAGCGLAWREPAGNRESLREMMERESLAYAVCREMVL